MVVGVVPPAPGVGPLSAIDLVAIFEASLVKHVAPPPSLRATALPRAGLVVGLDDAALYVTRASAAAPLDDDWTATAPRMDGRSWSLLDEVDDDTTAIIGPKASGWAATWVEVARVTVQRRAEVAPLLLAAGATPARDVVAQLGALPASGVRLMVASPDGGGATWGSAFTAAAAWRAPDLELVVDGDAVVSRGVRWPRETAPAAIVAALVEPPQLASGRRVEIDVGDAHCERHGGCALGATVERCTLEGGGHQWPGGEAIPASGEVNGDLDATAAMWAFFADHPRP